MTFKQRFDQKYKSDPNLFGREPMPVLKEALKYVSGGKALDLGVGNGRNALYLLDNGFEVTGVDISEEGIKSLKQNLPEHAKIKLSVSDVADYETDEKFDLICAVGLLHFFDIQNIKKLIKKMKDYTKMGGINVIGAKMTQNFRNDLPYVFKHKELKRFYTGKDWKIKYYKEIKRYRSKVATIIALKKSL